MGLGSGTSLIRCEAGRDINVVNQQILSSTLPQSRKDYLSDALRHSVARCAARWMALGVSEETAKDLAKDLSVGAPQPEFLPSPARPVVVLLGDLGIGKSLIADRLFQQAIQRALGEPSAPLPLFIDCSKGAPDLNKEIQRAVRAVEHDPDDGFTVIVDGAEQPGIGVAEATLQDADATCEWRPNTMIVITARSVPGLTSARQRVDVSPLEEQDARKLVALCAGRPLSFSEPYRWPGSVRESIRRPLFAVLLGEFIRSRQNLSSATKADLISSLVQRSLLRMRLDSETAQRVLQDLAFACIDQGVQKVHVSELNSSRGIVVSLASAGLLAMEDDYVGFSLPLFTEWFAAQGLRDRGMPSGLPGDTQRLSRWFYPLVIATGTLPHGVVSVLLSPIARNDPGMAARIVVEAISQWDADWPSEASLPGARESGERILHSMEAWAEGLGPLATEIAPVRPGGTLCQLGVHAEGRQLVMAWGAPDSHGPAILEIEPDLSVIDDRQWLEVRWTAPPINSAWAWRITHTQLTERLAKRIKRKKLFVAHGPLATEAAWRALLGLSDKSYRYTGPIDLIGLENAISSYPACEEIQDCRGDVHNLAFLRQYIRELRAGGQTEMAPPWPGPDRVSQGRWIWTDYSPGRQVELAQIVFSHALQGYEDLVTRWFPKLRFRLTTAIMLPAKLVGRVRTADETSRAGPAITWYLEPLPREARSYVEIEPGRVDYDDAIHRIRNAVRTHRRDVETLRVCGQVLDLSNDAPVSSLVYSWLEEDLKATAWL